VTQKIPPNTPGGNFVGENVSEPTSVRASSVSALGTVASPARLLDPVSRISS